MLYENFLPPNYCEVDNCNRIYDRLNSYLGDDYSLVCRDWKQVCVPSRKKYVTIITSSKQHDHIPPEKDDPNCLGVFMHYYPTETPYDPTLKYIQNVYPLHLGTKAGFFPASYRTMQKRKYSVGFIGQFDPYRRVEFKDFAMACSARYMDSFVMFYNGWNKGLTTTEYVNIMRETKIALVPCGSASLNTFRYYEAMASGCIVVREKLYSHPSTKQPLGDEVVVGDWKNHDQLFRIIDNYLKSTCIEMGRMANLRTYNNFLAPEACAEYIMDHIKELNYV